MSNLVVNYAFATVATTGPVTLIAGTVGSRIIISQIGVITSAPNVVTFSGTTAGVISGAFPLAANGGFVFPFSELGWMQTAIGDDFIVTLSAGLSTAIQIVYCLSTN